MAKTKGKKARSPAAGYTVFCDDIRQEAGGKLSYMGVYKGTMYINGKFPFLLPKFGFAIHFRQPMEVPRNPVHIQVYLPGDNEERPSLEGEIPIDENAFDRAKIDLAELEIDPNEVIFEATGLILASPLVLKQPGRIKIRAICDGEITKLGSLLVRQATPEDQSAS